ncbi:MAG: HAD family acid phosphatase [Myxococcaceae bacterium]
MRTERRARQRPLSHPQPNTTPAQTSNRLQNRVRTLDGVDAPKRGKSVDGEAWCKAELADIKLRTGRGEKVRVVFDIDDTLADTRTRTLQIAKAYDRAHQTHYFDKLHKSDVRETGEDTAKALGLPAAVVKDFSRSWSVDFWRGENFKYDVTLAKIVQLARQAKAAGADVTYLTGRVNSLRSFTLSELQSFGLPDADEQHLFCKPTIGTKTREYKVKELDQFRTDGFQLGWFFTESRRDTSWIQQQLPGVNTVLLAAAKETGGESVRADTPVFDAVTRTTR